MSADDCLRDAPAVLGLGRAPTLFVNLAESDPQLLARAWRATRKWIDSRYFEEAAVLAALAVEEAADALPPAGDPLRLGGLGGADLPEVDRMVEALLQRTVKVHLVCLAWHRAITEPGFGDRQHFDERPAVPGAARFMTDVPRPTPGGVAAAASLAEALSVPTAGDELRTLAAWPEFLGAAQEDLGARLGSDEAVGAIAQVRDRACEMVASLAGPLPDLEGASSDGTGVIEAWAEEGALLLIGAAYLRLLVPQVARIPHVA